MKNVQFISELPLILLENKIVGFDQDYLDQMYAKYDELEDIEDIFDLDNYRERKVYLKKLISDMEAANLCISTYAKTGTHMYIL
ncbi:MAG: hypothetical protein LIP04_06540 [Tannerellaceae bacterium]|nr:hypothetical protein [Tannerellaceae bacterium]